LLVAELAGITSRIQEIEHSHLERMESAATQLRDRLRDQIATEVRNQLQAEFQTGMEIIREEFKERMSAATAQWEAERQSLLNEIEDLRQRSNSRDTTAEVAQTEAELEAVQKKIQAMLDDSTVELSRVMKENSRQMELQAYLKGLRFKGVPSGASEMRAKAE
jgi:DNA repair exonuclease SbcCD ATPase subunit